MKIIFLNINIYPNPSFGLLNITGQSISSEMLVSLYIIEGKEIKVASTIENSNVITLYISNLASGVYFVKISEGNHSFVKRIIKQ